MPNYIAAADGNLTAGATWASVVEFADSESQSTVLTTAYVASAAFTPGAVTIDGIAVKVTSRAAVPSGTMSVRLAQAGALVAGTEVTIDVSDILGTEALQNGWLFFKFAAPVLLIAATLYTVDAKTSVAAMVTLYRATAAAGNWSRMVRTTTTGVAPIAGDKMYILGEWTAAATKTDRAVAMNSTAATDYGDASTTLASFGISNGGTLTWDSTAATNYLLRLSGLFLVWAGGVLNMGTTATPCPRDSSMQLEFDCAVDGDFGLIVWGTWNGQGQSRIAGSTNHYVLLNTDEAAGQTVLGTDSQLSAANGDDIAIAATTRTMTESETRVMSGDAGASSLTVTVGLTNAHSGSSPTQGEIISLTRAVRVKSVSTTAMAYVQLNNGCAVDLDWVGFQYLATATAGKRGVDWRGTTGSVVLDKCSFRNFEGNGFTQNVTGGGGEFTVRDCVFWLVGTSGTNYCVHIAEATTATWTITGNVGIHNSANCAGILIADLGGTMTNNRMAAMQNGYSITELLSNAPQKINGTIDNNLAHSCQSIGFIVSNVGGGRVSNTTVWRSSAGSGMTLNGNIANVVFDTVTLFGNTNINLAIGFSVVQANITFKRLTANGDSTFSTATGVSVTQTQLSGLRFEGSSLGVVSGIKTAHTTQDILLSASAKFFEITLVDTILASATEIANLATNNVGKCFVAYQKHDGVAGDNRTVYPIWGTLSMDTVEFRTASPSEKLVPSSAVAGARFESTPKRVACGSGQSVTISVYVNKSAGYTGSSPRLRVMENAAAGISEATVATHAGAAGSWIQLQGTVGPATGDCWLVFYVDCDGSAGQVNVDDYSASVS